MKEEGRGREVGKGVEKEEARSRLVRGSRRLVVVQEMKRRSPKQERTAKEEEGR